jgi:hypothetical protein
MQINRNEELCFRWWNQERASDEIPSQEIQSGFSSCTNTFLLLILIAEERGVQKEGVEEELLVAVTRGESAAAYPSSSRGVKLIRGEQQILG